MSVKPTTFFHIAETEDNGTVKQVTNLAESGIRMNGGFFAFRRQIFDYIRAGEELVDEPFARLIREKQLVTSRYDGFWLSMDTFKDKQRLDDLYFNGQAPWEVWKKPGDEAEDPTPPIGR